jgi:hypothetical protein
MFTPNRGQVNRSFDFIAKGPGTEIWIAPTQAAIFAGGQHIVVEFEGSRPDATTEEIGRTGGFAHYLYGGGAPNISNVPILGGVRIRDVYPGVDVVYGSAGRLLKSEFHVAGGSDPTRIRLRYHGADEVIIDPDGSLVIRTGRGTLRESRPEVFQDYPEGRTAIPAAFRKVDDKTVGFHLGSWDPSRPLVIDPELTYSSFLGGQMLEAVQGVAVDANGNTYVTGWTESPGFPSRNAIRLHAGSTDAFIAKIDASGASLTYATFLGGAGADRGAGLAVDSSGNVCTAGTTSSLDFPLAAASQWTNGGAKDAFVAKLNSSGSALVFSTYLGGSGSENAGSIAMDDTGNCYVGGDTTSTNFPVQAAYQSSLSGPQDAFLAKFAPTGARLYSTFFGGSGSDRALSLAVDSAAQPVLAGTTDSINLPVTSGVVQPASRGGAEGFVVKFQASGGSRVFSTYVGGNAGTAGLPEAVNGVAVDSSGNVYIAGVTSSTDFTTTASVFQTAIRGGGIDAFVAKLSPSGNTRLYSSYLGGAGADAAAAIRVDSAGYAYVVGYTASQDFPTSDAVQPILKGSYDAFLAKISPTGASLAFSTYLGGTGADAANAIAIDSGGQSYVAGQTQSFDFPSVTAFQSALQGGIDGFLAKLHTASVAQPPQGQSIEPATGTGVTHAFSFTYHDPNGYQTVAHLYGAFQSTDGSSNCTFLFRPSTGQLWLLSDDGLAWLGAIGFATSGVVQNSRCSINGTGSSFAGSGNTATVTVAVTFAAAFFGPKQTRMMVQDTGSLSSNWQNLGAWTAGTPVNYPPQVASVTPNSGTGLSQTFQVAISDQNGYADLRNVAVVINQTLSGTGACYFEIHPNANRIYLATDQVTGWNTMVLGGSGDVQNSQCSLAAAGSSVSLSGTTATVSVKVTFKPAFAGARSVYVLAFDSGGLNSNWITAGTWTVGQPAPVSPAAISVSPSSGTGTTQALQFVVRDGNGYQDIRNVAVVINNTLSSASSCYFEVHPNNGVLYLAGDQVTSWGSLTFGGAGVVQNSQCAVSASGSSVALSGNEATFTVNVTFKPAFAGHRNIYMLVFDQGGRDSGWATAGSWTVQ